MSSLGFQKAQVLVCQRGARHRYAIPRLFHDAGILTALYTDSSVYSPVGKLAYRLSNGGLKPPLLDALISRLPKDIPRHKIYSFDNLIAPNRTHRLSRAYKKAGLQGAHVVYSMCGEEFKFLRYTKEQGAKLIIDVFVHPGTERMLEEESLRYFGVSRHSALWIEDVEDHFRRSFELADIILCPSEWVAEGVREYSRECVDKIRIVPYGSSLRIRESINEDPIAGRVLFAGREALRKGLHYLADAAQILRARGLDIDVRVAGVSQHEVKWIKNQAELNCLGTLPMDMMHHEFEQADVFVLPSLSEGQAGVVLEAMACGCPVIATRESGVDFAPGCGLTVPACNTEALAEAIAHVVGDRAVRNKLAQGALDQANDFSIEAWKARLIQVANEAASI